MTEGAVFSTNERRTGGARAGRLPSQTRRNKGFGCYTEGENGLRFGDHRQRSGWYSAAARAGQYGLKTLLVEKSPKLGGTCLHVGCIPTKALLHTADVWEYFKHPDEQGIACKDPQLNYPKVLDRKNSIVSKHAKGVEFLMRKNKVDVVKGYGRLLGKGRVQVESDKGSQTIEPRFIMIATGSEARMLPGLSPTRI